MATPGEAQRTMLDTQIALLKVIKERVDAIEGEGGSVDVKLAKIGALSRHYALVAGTLNSV